MKIKQDLDFKILEKYGFNKIDQTIKDDYDDNVIAVYEYEYNLGHSRRGQFYSLLIYSTGSLSIYASTPDGSGGSITLDNTIYNLIKDGIIEPS